MIPFDLAQFDEVGKEGQTASTIEAIAKQSLTSSGIVRDSAAILLSRLYVRYKICKVPYPVNSTHHRRDALPRLPAFLDWAKKCAKEQKDIFEVRHSWVTGTNSICTSPVSWCLPYVLRSGQE